MPRRTRKRHVVFNSLAGNARTSCGNAERQIRRLRVARSQRQKRTVRGWRRDPARRQGQSHIRRRHICRRKPARSLGFMRAYSVVAQDKLPPQRKPHRAPRFGNEFYKDRDEVPARGGGMASLFDKEAKREVNRCVASSGQRTGLASRKSRTATKRSTSFTQRA